MSTNGENCIFRQMEDRDPELMVGLESAANRLEALNTKADPAGVDDLAELEQEKVCLEQGCDLALGGLLRHISKGGDADLLDQLKTQVAPDCALHDAASSWFES